MKRRGKLKTSLSGILLFFLPLVIFAHDFTVKFDKTTVKSLLEGYYVEKVINATGEDSCIGFVQTGMFNKQTAAYLLPSTSGAIEKLLKESFPKNDSSKPLIIRVNLLYIYELTFSSKEIACIQLNISFITREDTLYFEKFQAGTSFDESSMDATHLHLKNIIRALGICFDDFARREKEGFITNTPVTRPQLQANPLRNHQHELAAHWNKNQPGIFRTFYDFRDGWMDINFNYRVKYKDDKDTSFLRATLISDPPGHTVNVWGFYDGNHFFVNTGKMFYALHPSGDDYTTWVYDRDFGERQAPETAASVSSAAVMAGMMGGMVGGMVGGALIGGLAALTSATSNYGQDYKVDFATGTLTPVDPPDYLLMGSLTIFYVSKTSAYRNMKIIYKGKELCNAGRDHYIKMELPSKYITFSLSFQAGNGPVTTEEFNPRMFNTNVFLIKIKSNNQVTVTKVFDQVKKDVLNKITPARTTKLTSLQNE